MFKRFEYEWTYLRRIKLTPKGLIVLFWVLKDSVKWCFSINIGNHIYWDGSRYYVNNGITRGYWDCLKLNSDNKIMRDDKGIAENVKVPRLKCKKVRYITTPLNDFLQGFRFYMGYWYSIWLYDLSKYNKRPQGIRWCKRMQVFTSKN